MSQSPDLVQQRDRVVRLAREIERLSEADILAAEFFPAFLECLVASLEAVGAAVWLSDGSGLKPMFHCGLDTAGFLNPQAGQKNAPLLQELLGTGESKTYHPDTKSLPTPHMYMLSALSVAGEAVGAVELLQRTDVAPHARAGMLQFVEQMAGYASRYLARQVAAGSKFADGQSDGDEVPPDTSAVPAGPFTADAAGNGQANRGGLTPTFWTDLEKFLLQLERGRSVAEVAATAASDGRLLLGVDRVALVRRRGRKVPVEAISGQDKVNARANLVRRMSDLSRVVMEGREPFVYTGKVEGLPEQIEKPLAEYVAESHCRMIVMVPLFEPGELIKPEFEDKETEHYQRHAEPKVIGCWVAENINDSRIPKSLHEKIDVASDHVAAALYRSATFDRIFMRRALLTIGRTGEWFHGRKLAKTLAVLGLLTVVGLALWLVPYPYRVEAEGRLMPVTQRDVFAPWDGEVTQLDVEGGESVQQGTLLAVLRNDELRAELVRVRKEMDEKQQAVRGLAGQIDDAHKRAATDDSDRLEGERIATLAEIGGLEKQLTILKQRQERLTVGSPINGVVATFQLDQRLRNRPVRRGEVLMEVMDDQGTWHLELDVEDRRMGHLLRAMEASDSISLPVEFVLATDPERTFDGRLTRIASRAETDPEQGNIVRIEAAIANPDALPYRRIGAEVRAKINCGKRALFYVLFGDVVEFLQKYLWL